MHFRRPSILKSILTPCHHPSSFSFQPFYLMQPNTTADKLACDLLNSILEKMNANRIEEVVPAIEPMVLEDYAEMASKFPNDNNRL